MKRYMVLVEYEGGRCITFRPSSFEGVMLNETQKKLLKEDWRQVYKHLPMADKLLADPVAIHLVEIGEVDTINFREEAA